MAIADEWVVAAKTQGNVSVKGLFFIEAVSANDIDGE